MSRGATAALIALALVAYPVAGSASTVTFTDGAFNLADYTESPLYASGMYVTYRSCTVCGDPGNAVMITGTSTNRIAGAASLAFINSNFVYNPAAGQITSISASVNKDLITNRIVTRFGDTFHPTIEQGGNFYVASVSGPNLNGRITTYNTLAASGLTATDFEEYNFSTGRFEANYPNFSGGPMEFGLSQFFTMNKEFGLLARAYYDNLTITLDTTPAITVNPTPPITTNPIPPIIVNPTPPTAIPEASTWVMMLLGFAGFGFVGYLKARRQVSIA
jgi:hypothetical protein